MPTIDNKNKEIEGIVDPGSQIIAMSEGVCHDIGLLYGCGHHFLASLFGKL
jgi:hypothetical protein